MGSILFKNFGLASFNMKLRSSTNSNLFTAKPDHRIGKPLELSRSNRKRILLISYNFPPELTGIGKYNGEMLAWLKRKGHHCTALTAYPYYPHWRVQEPYTKYRYRYKTEVEKDMRSEGELHIHRCPLFVPETPSGLKRILLDLSFTAAASVKLVQLLLEEKFDIVIAVAPSFQAGLLGLLYKNLRGAKLLYHVQDLQIEAARDLKLVRSKILLQVLFSIEKYILDKSDFISSISEGMVRRVQKKAGREVCLVPNWADTGSFFPIDDRGALKKEFGFKASDTIILYSGAIGEKQGLEAILNAAQMFQESEGVKFLICGSGPYKEFLQSRAMFLKLQNVVFFPLQPFEVFNRFLNMADVHLVLQKHNASDLVMPSKLTTILAVGGLALVTANPGSYLYTLVDKYAMGILVEADNQQALNNGIRQAISRDNKQERTNARNYVQKFLCIEKVMHYFEEVILKGC